MSPEKIKKAAEQTGYLMVATKLIEEAVLLEQAPQNSQMAINVCLQLAGRLRARADELQTKAIELMVEDETNVLYMPAVKSETRDRQRLGYRLSECLKVINHIAEAVGCKDDPMSCWESVDELVSRVKGGAPSLAAVIAEHSAKEIEKAADYMMDYLGIARDVTSVSKIALYEYAAKVRVNGGAL